MTTREPLPQTSDLCWNANSSCPGPGTLSEITRPVSHRNDNCSLELMLLSCPYPWWLQPSWLQQVFWARPWCSAQGRMELRELGSPCPQGHLRLEWDKEGRKVSLEQPGYPCWGIIEQSTQFRGLTLTRDSAWHCLLLGSFCCFFSGFPGKQTLKFLIQFMMHLKGALKNHF